MKYIKTELALMKGRGVVHKEVVGLPNAAQRQQIPLYELTAMQARVERRFPNGALSCRAGVWDVEPIKRYCKVDRERVSV